MVCGGGLYSASEVVSLVGTRVLSAGFATLFEGDLLFSSSFR